jgi:uncharacterized protein YhaN
MDHALLAKHLEEAERQVAQGKDHIAKQQAIIADLERDGHDTRQARTLLETLLESQALHEQHRGWLLRQIMES